MEQPKLYRKRYIPDVVDYLDKDEIVSISNGVIITKWRVINPRDDIAYGVSCYYMDRGVKISKVFDADEEFVYYYCDIIETEKNENGDYIFNDLLLDVIIYADGFVKVIDTGELADAMEQGLITAEQVKKALKSLDYLLNEIYSERFHKLSKLIDETL